MEATLRIASLATRQALASRPGLWTLDRFFVRPTQSTFRQNLAEPAAAQAHILHGLTLRAGETQFGLDHDFASISNLDDFQSHIPVRSYEELRVPYINAMLQDRQLDILWPGRVDWFAESSGTSGAKKQIPFTRDAMHSVYHAAARRYFAALLTRVDRRRFAAGKTVFFVGGARQAENDPHLLLGDITAISMRVMPWHYHLIRAPKKEIMLIPNWEERVLRMAEATARENIVHLAGIPTWIKRFGQMALGVTGCATLRDIWPNLSVMTLGGVNPQPYLRDLNRLALGQHDNDGTLLYSEVYNGTEGFYAMQIDDRDMVLIPDVDTFYEFVPARASRDGDFSSAVPLADVTIGEEYALILSNANGLWRYLVGDTVRFTAARPYRLRVTGRVSQSLDISGEELLVSVTDAAMQRVCDTLGVGLVDYMAAGLKLDGERENACHLWLVELAGDPGLDGASFARCLDQDLIASHYDYAGARRAGANSGDGFSLGAPIVLVLPPATFYRWLQRRFDGKASAQSKVPRLTDDLALVGEVLGCLAPDAVERWADTLPPNLRKIVTELSVTRTA